MNTTGVSPKAFACSIYDCSCSLIVALPSVVVVLRLMVRFFLMTGVPCR